MKFTPPENQNYCATVVRVKNLIPLNNCDNLLGTTFFGFQAIVGKDTNIGDLGILFPPEVQLSDEYCKQNNLYRHADLNADQSKKGYVEDNRRVKAIKFRGNVSNALFMPLSSLGFVLSDTNVLEEGNEFDKIGDVEICRKYVVFTRGASYTSTQSKRVRRVDHKHFPEHFSTDNYFKFGDSISPESLVVVTQKLHGTSIRIANTIVKRKLNWIEKIAKFFGAKVKETEYSYVFGSRKVLKDANNPDHAHFYDTDIWTTEGKKLEGLIPENFLVFGELVGWTETGTPIQTDYTYCLPKNTCRLFVYRVAFVNEQGLVVDLSWEQTKEFCAQRNLNVVPELVRIVHKELDAASFLDKRYHDETHAAAIPLEAGMVDEGVCIRVEGLTPRIFKAKSSKFLEHETKLLDKGEADLESVASV